MIPRAPASSSASTSSAVERGAPQLERAAELEDAVVERVDQRPRLVGRERLDPERGGERDDDAIDALALGLGRARDGIVVTFLQRAERLAGQLEAQRTTGAHHLRSRRTPRQRADQRLREEVLVEVGPHRLGHIRTKSTDLVARKRPAVRLPETRRVRHRRADPARGREPRRRPRPGRLRGHARAAGRAQRTSAQDVTPVPTRGCRPARPAWPRRRSPRRRCPPRAAARRACPTSASRAPRA